MNYEPDDSCIHWYEIDDNYRSCFEYCKAHHSECGCSGIYKQCNHKDLFVLAQEEQMKALTWEDLANFYEEKTSGNARTKKMDTIFNWAAKQKEIKVINNTLCFKEE